jgi:hypothetical protein
LGSSNYLLFFLEKRKIKTTEFSCFCHPSDRACCLHSSSIDRFVFLFLYYQDPLWFLLFSFIAQALLLFFLHTHTSSFFLHTPTCTRTHTCTQETKQRATLLVCLLFFFFLLFFTALLLSIDLLPLSHTHTHNQSTSLATHGCISTPSLPFLHRLPLPPSSRYLVASLPPRTRTSRPTCRSGSEQTHITHTHGLPQRLVPKAHVSNDKKKCGNSVMPPKRNHIANYSPRGGCEASCLRDTPPGFLARDHVLFCCAKSYLVWTLIQPS